MIEGFLYAIKNRKTGEIARNIKCKGGSFYQRRCDCEKRQKDLNKAFEYDRYKIAKYKLVEIEEDTNEEIGNDL